MELNLLYHKELDYLATDMLRGTLGNYFPGLPLSLISFPSTKTENRRCLISQCEHQSKLFLLFLQRRANESLFQETDAVGSHHIFLIVIASVSVVRSVHYLTLICHRFFF